MDNVIEGKMVTVKSIEVKAKDQDGQVVTRKTPATVGGNRRQSGSCHFAVWEMKNGKMANDRVYYEPKVSRDKARAYLQALGWQNKCESGISIQYYTVK